MKIANKAARWFVSFVAGAIATFALGWALGEFVPYNLEHFTVPFVVYTAVAVLLGASVAIVLTPDVKGDAEAVAETGGRKHDEAVAAVIAKAEAEASIADERLKAAEADAERERDEKASLASQVGKLEAKCDLLEAELSRRGVGIDEDAMDAAIGKWVEGNKAGDADIDGLFTEADGGQAAKEAARLAKMADEFEKTPFDAQTVVCMVHDGGDLKMPSSWRSMTDDPSWFAQRWMTWRALPDGEDLWRLTETTSELLEARPDLLEPARDYLEELAAERAEEDARKQAAERFERARRSPDSLISCIGTVAELRTLDWIVGEGGRYDEDDVPDYYDVATLDNLGLIDRYCPDVMTADVVAVLDDEIQRSFEDMENVNLIYAKIAELQEMEDLGGSSGTAPVAGEPGEGAQQPEQGPRFEA